MRYGSGNGVGASENSIGSEARKKETVPLWPKLEEGERGGEMRLEKETG